MGRSMKKVENHCAKQIAADRLPVFVFQSNCTDRICGRVTRCSISFFATRWSRWRNKRQCISIGKCLGPRYGSRDSGVVVDRVPLYIQNIQR